MAAPPPPRRTARLAAVLAVVFGLLVARSYGVFDHVTEPSRLAESIVGMGAWGYTVFIVAFALLQPFGVPGTVFVIAAPLLWPWPVAYGLSMAGSMSASVIGFSFARFLARDWVAPRIPARFRKYEEALARRGFATVFVLRFVFWMPQVLHAFFGVSRVSGWTHFWGSLAGYAVPLLVMSYFGQRVFDLLRTATPTTWLFVGLGAAVAVSAFALGRWHALARQRAERA